MGRVAKTPRPPWAHRLTAHWPPRYDEAAAAKSGARQSIKEQCRSLQVPCSFMFCRNLLGKGRSRNGQKKVGAHLRKHDIAASPIVTSPNAAPTLAATSQPILPATSHPILPAFADPAAAAAHAAAAHAALSPNAAAAAKGIAGSGRPCDSGTSPSPESTAPALPGTRAPAACQVVPPFSGRLCSGSGSLLCLRCTRAVVEEHSDS